MSYHDEQDRATPRRARTRSRRPWPRAGTGPRWRPRTAAARRPAPTAFHHHHDTNRRQHEQKRRGISATALVLITMLKNSKAPPPSSPPPTCTGGCDLARDAAVGRHPVLVCVTVCFVLFCFLNPAPHPAEQEIDVCAHTRTHARAAVSGCADAAHGADGSSFIIMIKTRAVTEIPLRCCSCRRRFTSG
eukprot:COSAG01_NODE_312_length_19063_cov_207.879825_10_plen_189_part_00